jgi:cation:H+ antiporter
MTIAILVVALLVILIGAEGFTNALEHLGERLKISEGVTGSILAAVGTAMPETMVPVVAIFSVGSNQAIREEVGVGAILGAPLMLSTLSLFLMGVFAAQRRGWNGALRPERSGLHRDLSWFLLSFGLSAGAIFVPHDNVTARALIATVLVGIYFLYLLLTVRASGKLVADGHGTEAGEPLYLLRVLGFLRLKPNLVLILIQLAIGLAAIVLGARGFVYGVEDLSGRIGISALVLSLLIVPVATELPEKVNSILWIRKRKDTLAFGNITGAMVFQGSLLPAIGIMLTPWDARREVLAGLVVTIVASLWLFVMLRRGTLRPYHLVANGVCYVAYLAAVFR